MFLSKKFRVIFTTKCTFTLANHHISQTFPFLLSITSSALPLLYSSQNPTSSRPGPSNVWTTVDIDVVDFSKRPDPPFSFVFHAKDEVSTIHGVFKCWNNTSFKASQYSYACPMIDNQPEVVADAVLNLFYLFGSPNSVKLDPAYRGEWWYLEANCRFLEGICA